MCVLKVHFVFVFLLSAGCPRERTEGRGNKKEGRIVERKARNQVRD